MELNLSLRQISIASQTKTTRSFGSPTLGVSALELEVLLDQSLSNVAQFYSTNPSVNPPKGEGNYFLQKNFLDGCKDVKGKIPKEKYLENPEIIIEYINGQYLAKYNDEITQRLEEKLSKFKIENSSLEQIFSKQVREERKWINDNKIKIGRYLCDMQDKYLKTNNPFDLRPINISYDIANYIGYSRTTTCYLTKDLTIQLPNKSVIFANDLIPASGLSKIRGKYALKELMKDPELYLNKEWKVSNKELRILLKEKFNISLSEYNVYVYNRNIKKDYK